MVGIDGAMHLDAQPPAIKQSGHAMHRGMTMWAAPLAEMDRRLAVIALVRQTTVGDQPSVRTVATRRHGCLDKRDQAPRSHILDAAHSDPASAPPSDFRRNRDDRLGLRLSPHDAGFPAAHIGFVHLDRAAQEITPRPHHGAPKLVQPSPERSDNTTERNA